MEDDVLKHSKYWKIIWVCVMCLAFLASCARMESNVIRVHAEETTEDATEPSIENEYPDANDWSHVIRALEAAVGKLANIPTKANFVMLAIQFAIAEMQPIATAGDVSVYDGVSSLMCDYMFDGSTYHIVHIGGSRRTNFSDSIYQYDILTYPSGSSAYYSFQNNGSVYIDVLPTGLKCIGAGYSRAGYTAPNAIFVSGNKIPFSIYTNGGSPTTCVKKYTDNNLNSGILCSTFGGVFGYDEIADVEAYLPDDDSYFILPDASDYTDANEYLSDVYQKYEDEYNQEFEFLFPTLVPVGTLMPDGTIQVKPDLPNPDLPNPDLPYPDVNVDVDVNVEFPTYDVPDNSEPETFPLETVPEITEHETDEIPDDVFLGFDFWWNSALALISLFDIWDVLMVILWTSLICFLLWR